MRLMRLMMLCSLAAWPLQGVCQTTFTSAAPGVRAGKTLYVDSINGDNGTAKRGRIDKAYKTIQAALNATSAGDVVFVRSGSYGEFLVLKNADLFFEPGAKMVHTAGTGNVLSDSGGAVTCTIVGLDIAASGTGTIKGIDLSAASRVVLQEARDILITATGAGSNAIECETATLSVDGRVISSTTAVGLDLISGTVRVNCEELHGAGVIGATNATAFIRADLLVAEGDVDMIAMTGGADLEVRFGTMDDSEITDADFCNSTGSGSTTLYGGRVTRTTAGNVFEVSSDGFIMVQSGDYHVLAGFGYVFKQSGDGSNIVNGAVTFDGTSVFGGAVTRRALYGTDVTNSAMSALAGLTEKYKSSDTTRTSTTTTTADPDLSVAVSASGVYKFEARLFVRAGTDTPDWKGGLTFPTSPTGVTWTMEGWDYIAGATTGRSIHTSADTSTSYAVTTSGSSSNVEVRISGTLRNGVNAGNIAVSWSQATSSADPTIVGAQSRLTVQKVN